MNYFQLIDRLIGIYSELEGLSVDSERILKKIKKSIPFKDCKFSIVKSLGLIGNEFSIAGQYDPVLDELGKPSISIEILLPKDREYYDFVDDDFSRDHWKDFCKELVGILGHEYIHLNQFRKRNFNWSREYKSSCRKRTKKELQEYYGDSDEVDAYAFMAAATLVLATVEKKTQFTKQKLCRNNVYKTYKKIFDKKDPVVLKFEKLTLRYYKKLEQQYHATTIR